MTDSNDSKIPMDPSTKLVKAKDGNSVDIYARPEGSSPEGSKASYSDSSYGINTDQGKRTTGIIFYFGESPITWCSQKQPIVALSSCESDFMAATGAACQALWLKRLLSELTGWEEKRITLKVDNISAIALVRNPVFHGRSKHIDILYHFIRECVENGHINMEHVSRELQRADILTKALPRLKFVTMRQMLGTPLLFLGLEVIYTPSGLFLSQSKYVYEILDRAKLLDCKSVATPLATATQLSTLGSPYSDPTLYHSLVGALQYLTITRPDLSYAVNQGTLSYGLSFDHSLKPSLVGYSDADWARFIETRRSTYGYSIFLGRNLVSRSAKKQPTVSRSSCESEYRALANTAAEIVWVTHLLLSTRETVAVMNDATRKSLSDLVNELVNSVMDRLRHDLLSQRPKSSNAATNRTLGNGNKGNSQFSRVTKIEILKFEGKDGAILKRFDAAYDDPLGKIKKLQQTNSVQEYIDAFDRLLCKINLEEDQCISFFLAGLNSEMELVVRMFKLRTLEEVYGLCKFEEAKISLTQKELEEKRVKNQCFYCDQKHIPSHKCSGQVLSLEVLGNDTQKVLATDFLGETSKEHIEEIEELIEYSPHISLNAINVISHPLTQLLKKNGFEWTAIIQEAFDKLKQAMMEAPVLKLPNFNDLFVIETDASYSGIGAVLRQGGHPVAYYSKNLAPRHHTLSTYEKELLDVIMALNK
nr:zinc finger, CCHC-type [Tanacetum cinerariifolium]